MRRLLRRLPLMSLALLAACATAPKSQTERDTLQTEAQATLNSMQARDAGLQPVLDQSAGYAVFPEVGKGGVLVGGAYGRGILYENGQPIGFVELNQAQIGALLGGESFSEVIVFEDQDALAKVKDGRYDVGANASAVALTAGAAASTEFRDGVAVFVMPRGGLMADVSVSGQKINFESASM